MRKLVYWIDDHPRTGWYIAVVVTADFILHILESSSVV